jgi:heme/copper-type cytochrome/quinol oxidase subunit 1
MTVTEASRDVVEASGEAGTGAADVSAPTFPAAPPAGLAGLVGSGDPRTVGKLFVGTSLLFLLVSGATGVVANFDRAIDATDAFLGGTANQVYSLSAVSGLFLVVLPLLIGLATAVVPLQVGASTVAFPRASAAAYWTYLAAGGLILAAYALDGGPFGNRPDPVALFIAGFIALLVALTVATISVVTTVLVLRAPGMSLRRTPLFSWSMVVAGTVWTLTLPVVAALLLLTYVDLRYGQQFLGGANGVYDRLVWTFWQPTVYAFAVPALGIVADIVPVFAQRRHHKHRIAMFLIGLFGALGFGAYAQLGATIDGSGVPPTPWLYDGPWVVVSFVALVPVLGLLGLWTTTLGLGRPRLRGPLLLALPAGLLVLLGVAAGLGTAVEDLDVAATTWMTGQANAVLIGTLLAGFAGLTFWAPKLYGKLVPDGAVGLAAVLVLLGALAYVVPDALSGVLDQSRFVTDSLEGLESVSPADLDTVKVLNLVSAIGAAVVVAGVLAFVAALAKPRGGAETGDDPWSGHTLEWATASPPPVGNFAELPEITSEAPLYDARHAAAASVTEGPE